MRTFRDFVGAGALALIGLGGAIVVHGGWEAVAAALAGLAGIGAVFTFALIGAFADSASGRHSALRRREYGATIR